MEQRGFCCCRSEPGWERQEGGGYDARELAARLCEQVAGLSESTVVPLLLRVSRNRTAEESTRFLENNECLPPVTLEAFVEVVERELPRMLYAVALEEEYWIGQLTGLHADVCAALQQVRQDAREAYFVLKNRQLNTQPLDKIELLQQDIGYIFEIGSDEELERTILTVMRHELPPVEKPFHLLPHNLTPPGTASRRKPEFPPPPTPAALTSTEKGTAAVTYRSLERLFRCLMSDREFFLHVWAQVFQRDPLVEQQQMCSSSSSHAVSGRLTIKQFASTITT